MREFKVPRTTEAATAYLMRFAEIEGAIGAIDARRNAAIAAANAAADTASEQLLADRDALLEKLAPWWAKSAAKLTQGKRKSIELGGCIIGSRKAGDSLAVAGDEAAIAKLLVKRPWAGDLVVTAPRLDKAAIKKALAGKYKAQLARLGLSLKIGDETFFITRAEQAGTVAEVQS